MEKLEKFAVIFGSNFRLALAELDMVLRTEKYRGKIIDYSTTAAIVEFQNPNANVSTIGSLMVQLGMSQKIVIIKEFIERRTFMDGFPESTDERKTEIFNGRDKIKAILRDVIFKTFGDVKGKSIFVANSIYPEDFKTSYYKVLINHFLIFSNKFMLSYLKERGAKNVAYYNYPEEQIKKSTLHPIFPHHFFAYKLYEPNRKEFVYCLTEEGCYVGYTQTVVDSNFYKLLDEHRPYVNFKRSIPPKIAKALINFLGYEKEVQGRTLLDPFCGSGTILMFAKLLGYDVHGADIGEEEVFGTAENVKYLYESLNKPYKDEVIDRKIVRTDIKNIHQHFKLEFFDAIVSEPILLPFYTELPKFNEIAKIMDKEVLPTYKAFIEQAYKLLKKGGRCVFTSPTVLTVDGPKISIPVEKLAKKAGFRLIPIFQYDRIVQKSSKALSIRDWKSKAVLDTQTKYIYREFIILEKPAGKNDEKMKQKQEQQSIKSEEEEGQENLEIAETKQEDLISEDTHDLEEEQ
jgi:tRNA G10  N-methylase Trm11